MRRSLFALVLIAGMACFGSWAAIAQPADTPADAAAADASPDTPADAAPDTPPPAPQTSPAPASKVESGASDAEKDDAATSAVTLPAIEEEVRGTCATPRQTWLQMLYWLQKGERWEPQKAAICFDTSGLADPTIEGPKRARMLKETLDSRSALIKVDNIPSNPDYRDNVTGEHLYIDPVVREIFGQVIFLVRDPRTKRWLFSAETVAAVPDLYPVTGSLESIIPSWLKVTVLGIDLWKYLALLLIYFVARLVKVVVMFVLGRYIRTFIQRTAAMYLDRLIERSERPIGVLSQALVFYLGIPLLLLPIRFTDLAMVIIEAMAAFAAVWLSYRLIDVLTDFMIAQADKTESKLDDQLVPLVSKTLKVFVSLIGGIFILQNLEVNVGSLLAGLGLGGLAFALAAKDTVANFFGSVMIFIDKPFQIGDWVVIGSTEGVVEEVGFRTSRVRTFYNSLVTVPNAMITSTMIDNYGARKYRRYVANLGLCYDTPPDKVEAFCEGVRAILVGMPGMRKDFYLVEFKEFADSSLIIMLYCFMETGTWNEELRVRTNLNLEIMRLAEKLGVSFAYPTQTLHVASIPKQGDSWPSHSGPEKPEELLAVIDGFGPGGSLARPGGIMISKGYSSDAPPARGSDDDGG